MILTHGQKYRAELTGIPFFVGGGTIVDHLQDVGVQDCSAWKRDGVWMAEGTWAGSAQEVTDAFLAENHIKSIWPVAA